MKKHSAIAFVSALVITAGTFTACAGGSSFPGTKEASVLSAVAEASVTGASAEGGVLSASDNSIDHDGSIAYEEAIAELYARSTSISDQEILEIARKMKPDGTAAAKVLGDAEAAAILETISRYENEKASYLLDGEDAPAEEALSCEWKRQDAYTQMGMCGGQTLTSLIPGYTITSCREEDGKVLVDVDEWMTEGYTEGEDRDTVNVSAYRYYFTAVLAKNSAGSWKVVSVTDTDRNFTWLEDIEVQEEYFTGEESDLFAAAEADAAAAASPSTWGTVQKAAAGDVMTSTLKTYGDGKYTYSPEKAVAYADKWATSRNPQYKQYPGVDCCNFVSQCLYAGGMPKNSTWYPASYDWINCSGAISNFKKYGKFMTANDSNVLKGNPVYYDWNSNGVYDHTAICVGRNSAGTPIIDAHTGDHYHVAWRLGKNGKRATIQLRNGGNVSGTATQASGGKWVKKNGKWYYYSANGKPVRGWLNYKNETYFLSKSGMMVTGWYKISGAWYYFGKNGEMKTGWVTLGSRKYCLADSGKMKTGWVSSKGKWYYMCSDGYAVTGWKTVRGETYYFNKQCVMQTGLTKIDGMNYYFDSQGRKKLGWVTLGNKKYFFSPSAGGRAATGYWDINNTIYYFNSEGVLNG